MALSWWQAAPALVPTVVAAAPLTQSSTSICVSLVPPRPAFPLWCFCALLVFPGVASGHAECLGFAKDLQRYCVSPLRLPYQNNSG